MAIISGNQRQSEALRGSQSRIATCPERLADCYEIRLNPKARLGSTKT